MSKRGVHDLGGLPAGPVDCHEHAPTLTERRIDAMMMIMRDKRFWVTDENRRTIESMAKGEYERTSYYAKWCFAMRSLVVEKGLLTEAEIARKLTEVRARYAAGEAAAKPTPKSPAVAKSATKGAKKGARGSAAAAEPSPAAKPKIGSNAKAKSKATTMR